MLGCDWKAVRDGGVDPCKVATIHGEDGVSNSLHQCYNVGDDFLNGWGACGYNCTVFHGETGEPCPELGGDCFIYCDSRTFPGMTESDFELELTLLE